MVGSTCVTWTARIAKFTSVKIVKIERSPLERSLPATTALELQSISREIADFMT